MLTTGAVLIAATLAVPPRAATLAAPPQPLRPIAEWASDPPRASASTGAESSTIDSEETRPRALVPLYSSFAALQALDVYSTRRAIDRGAVEVNPIVEKTSGNLGAAVAVKVASSAAAIYFTERAWKKNRKGAVILMAAINGVTAAVVAHNLRNGR